MQVNYAYFTQLGCPLAQDCKQNSIVIQRIKVQGLDMVRIKAKHSRTWQLSSNTEKRLNT